MTSESRPPRPDRPQQSASAPQPESAAGGDGAAVPRPAPGTEDAAGGTGARKGRTAGRSGPGAGPAGAGYADRVYRSPAGIAGGVLLLALVLWLVGDAVLGGTGRTPWIALAGSVCVVPLIVAFTLRPVVTAGSARLRVRNPFRTVTLPWGAVETLRSGYTNEVVAGGTKYQLWALPVSLRARKKAARREDRAARGAAPARPGGLLGFGGAGSGGGAGPDPSGPRSAPTDEAVRTLRELAERHGAEEAAQGRVTVRWAYEVLVPAVVGAVATVVLLVTG